MDFSTLRDNLRLPYLRSNWKEWLQYLFANQISVDNQAEKIFIEKGNAKKIERFASIELSDSRNIAVIDIETTSDVQIARNRVALRDIAFKLIDQDRYHGLLVFYYSEDKNQVDYRLSFISSLTEFDADGNLVKQTTHPKRFSFLLGANETCTTATYRFLDLKAKTPKFKAFDTAKGLSLKDINDTFSVEALNNEFFKKYKDVHYKRFWEFIANNEGYATVLLNKDETDISKQQKPIRDFVKKMLGRIVFLHFLQKKGWLGVPAIVNDKLLMVNEEEKSTINNLPLIINNSQLTINNWKGGDKSFMLHLFEGFENKESFYSKCLTTLFYDTLNTKREGDLAPKELTINHSSLTIKIPYLNGGLFDDDQPATNSFNFPVDYFKDLFDFFEQYNFTIDENSPEEQEVGIDPEMLGHIFENLLEENKDKGAFYTPKEIVHYMCQESLIQYLLTQLLIVNDRLSIISAIENFIRKNDIGDRTDKKNFVVANAKRIEAILDKVKICDPAIGSGAFPMGMLQEIFKAKLTLDLTLDKAQVKKEIIQNSIYGVDLEKGAVDIARLRFWLALVVDEEEPQPLPNLDYKIMQGNSLLESFEEVDLSTLLKNDDEQEIVIAHKGQIEMQGFGKNQSVMLFEQKDKQELQKLIDLYFDFNPVKSSNPANPHSDSFSTKAQVKQAINNIVEGKLKAHFYREQQKIDSQIIETKKLADTITITATQSKVVQQKNQKAKDNYNKKIATLTQQLTHLTEIVEKLNQWEHNDKERPYFLWHTYFKDVFDKGGFDIVIGNPPYIQMQKDGGILSELLQKAGYETFERTGDIYALFYELGFNFLRKNGIHCFITSSQWIRANYGKSLRKYFLKKNPLLLLQLGPGIFENATVDTNILFAQNTSNNKTLKGIVINTKEEMQSIALSKMESMTYITEDSWSILNPTNQSIKSKISLSGKQLSEWNLKINFGIKTGYNEAIVNR